MDINRIASSSAYSKSSYGLEMDKFIAAINSQLENELTNKFTFKLNASKTNKKQFYFENLNFKSGLIDSVKFTAKYLLISLVIIIAAILILVNFEAKIFVLFGQVLLLGWLWKFYQFVKMIINFPKKLILKNGYIYEKSIVNRTIKNCFFDEINYKEFENYKYYFFMNKKSIKEDTVILFSENETQKIELEKFFEDYVSIAHDIKLQEYRSEI